MGRPDSAEKGLGFTPASFLCSPPRDSITVVLGQHFFNRTTDVTQTFGIEKYVPYTLYSVFSPSDHDLGELRARQGVCVCVGGGVCVPQARAQTRVGAGQTQGERR